MKVEFLSRGRARQEIVAVTSRDSHLDVAVDDQFALGLVLQDLDRSVVVTCLVDDRVSAVLPDHLDGHIQLDVGRVALLATGTFRSRTPGADFSPTPALKVSIAGPWSMASNHEKTEMILFDGLVRPGN